MARVFLLILDSFGIGGASDAALFGDQGANTFGHIADHCASKRKKGPLCLKNLNKLGLGHAAQLAIGDNATHKNLPEGLYGAANEVSNGKDTPSGHWEIAGQPVSFDWGYFPKDIPAFPKELTDSIGDYLKDDSVHNNLSGSLSGSGLDWVLGNCHASGTDIIQKHGVEHMRSGQPICYTSTDSVFQIAAHEETFGLERLYKLCEFVRAQLDALNIGRVIARPFIGQSPSDFSRTGNRKDYSVLPPAPTVLDLAKEAGCDVIGIGKISDIYAHQGITKSIKADGNMALFDQTLERVKSAKDNSLVITNFVDFDMLYGHRRDIEGYAQALEAFDQRLPELVALLKPDDLVIITADHGCDPTWQGTDHTRERVPVLGFGPKINARNIGIRDSFCDIGASIADHLSLPETEFGKSFL